MLKTQAVPTDLIIRIKESVSVLPAEIECQIGAIWELEKLKKGDYLFNGEVLSFVSCEKGILEARITDYRTYLAQLREPSLYDQLKVRTLALSGLVVVESDVVFGRRADYLTQDAGKWELVPSGGLTPRAIRKDGRLAFEEQILEELAEELGVARTMVNSLNPFLIVEDTLANVIDIGIAVDLSIRRVDVERACKRRSDEYSEISWINISEIDQFCFDEGRRSGIVEVSLELLKSKNLLSADSKIG